MGPSEAATTSTRDGSDPLEATAEDIHEAFRAAGRDIPRYLFRGWGTEPGGAQDGKTATNAIVPPAFLEGKGPATVTDIDGLSLRKITLDHLGENPAPAVTTSWTPELRMAIGFAETAHARGEDAYISIVDTKQLDQHNFVYDTLAKSLTEVGIPGIDFEFHIFGRISESRHETAVYVAQDGQWLRLLTPDQFPPTGADLKSLAEDLALKFGTEFALPVAVNILCTFQDVTQNQGLQDWLQQKFARPAAWTDNQRFQFAAESHKSLTIPKGDPVEQSPSSRTAMAACEILLQRFKDTDVGSVSWSGVAMENVSATTESGMTGDGGSKPQATGEATEMSHDMVGGEENGRSTTRATGEAAEISGGITGEEDHDRKLSGGPGSM